MLRDLLFKSDNICLFCKENIGDSNSHICSSCMDLIEIVNKEVKTKSPYINTIYYACLYNRFIRDNLHSFKFEGKPYLYKAFGEILLNTIGEVKLDEKIQTIVYVPIHRKKEALRGYNQSELLSNYIGEKLNIPLIKNNLIKDKWTIEQSKLNKIQRGNNLKDSFAIKKAKDIEGKEILLIDDIITTGSTMEECAKVLKKAGAKNIYGLALTSGMGK